MGPLQAPWKTACATQKAPTSTAMTSTSPTTKTATTTWAGKSAQKTTATSAPESPPCSSRDAPPFSWPNSCAPPTSASLGSIPKIHDLIDSAADDLVDEGIMDSDERSLLSMYTASGDGWPFHHHHMHFSWEWESGHTERTMPLKPQGCQDALIAPPGKVRKGPGL